MVLLYQELIEKLKKKIIIIKLKKKTCVCNIMNTTLLCNLLLRSVSAGMEQMSNCIDFAKAFKICYVSMFVSQWNDFVMGRLKKAMCYHQ